MYVAANGNSGGASEQAERPHAVAARRLLKMALTISGRQRTLNWAERGTARHTKGAGHHKSRKKPDSAPLYFRGKQRLCAVGFFSEPGGETAAARKEHKKISRGTTNPRGFEAPLVSPQEPCRMEEKLFQPLKNRKEKLFSHFAF